MPRHLAMTYDVLIPRIRHCRSLHRFSGRAKRVAVPTRGQHGRRRCQSWAQGGIAAALADDDSPAPDARDTLAAGLQRNDADAVARLTGAAAAAVAWLSVWGLLRPRRGGQLRLVAKRPTPERASRARRRDASGPRRCAVWRGRRPHRTSHAAGGSTRRGSCCARTAAWSVCWACAAQGEREVLADRVVLATGGIGALYRYTTNPPESDGSGLALSHAAGAAARRHGVLCSSIRSALAPASDAGGQLPPLTEALRGAGAVVNDAAPPASCWPRCGSAELAPRDVVARAAWAELQR